jgi:hypothetical protein
MSGNPTNRELATGDNEIASQPSVILAFSLRTTVGILTVAQITMVIQPNRNPIDNGFAGRAGSTYRVNPMMAQAAGPEETKSSYPGSHVEKGTRHFRTLFFLPKCAANRVVIQTTIKPPNAPPLLSA